jgi:hypothetical protein
MNASQRWFPGLSVDDAPAPRRRRAAEPEAQDRRRLRIPDDMPPRLRRLLIGLAQAAATCRGAIRAYVDPTRMHGRTGQRIAAGDISILDEYAATAVEQIEAVRDSIERQIRPRRAVPHLPGTRGKIDAIIRRADAGMSLFHPDDPR